MANIKYFGYDFYILYSQLFKQNTRDFGSSFKFYVVENSLCSKKICCLKFQVLLILYKYKVYMFISNLLHISLIFFIIKIIQDTYLANITT